ncbi:MAG: NusG domain II-containing protein, partial [Clostridia bacterium]|nr:NusG domain II-containing protein [Clostridia bacterium]
MPHIKHIMKKISIKRKTKNDIILTALILVLAVLVFFIMGLITKNGNYVEVKRDGAVIGKYPLSEDRVVDIKNENGYNILTLENGKAYISEASCPDKLCMKQ